MDPVVVAALVGVGGTLTVSAFGYFQARSNGNAMRTNNGKRPGEYIELIAGKVNDLDEKVDAHGARLNRIEAAIHKEGAATRQNTRDRADEIKQGRIDT